MEQGETTVVQLRPHRQEFALHSALEHRPVRLVEGSTASSGCSVLS
ncbi:hypothetical protein SLNWT_5240 [Streptomyces albus]|uniref:Uncharacterized protein n=1 Tax=Streptomyces albus (strain ATCC 21838 / DSM 41398 / FERM P-419 / JCM 4703 / NBRC 107858) TaxID=1081613 RepID=A0A0B5F3X3_STRA4|nr:hypothetical protein SLNWT_5240 [Streptomyces albus]AOU79918.1 hypothetical protein SLNHY_5227 [Streptomyces albus]